jgi:Family of unknown function (DUF6496)
MPDPKTVERAHEDKREGKSPSTQAGEFVREEIRHIRQGRHGAKSPEQAIAIGLSEARRAGVDLPVPKAGTVSDETRRAAKRSLSAGKRARRKKPSAKRSRATTAALKRAGRKAASKAALSKHAKSAARKRTARARSAAARKAVRTKGPAARSAAAKKAARTRARRRASRRRKR